MEMMFLRFGETRRRAAMVALRRRNAITGGLMKVMIQVTSHSERERESEEK